MSQPTDPNAVPASVPLSYLDPRRTADEQQAIWDGAIPREGEPLGLAALAEEAAIAQRRELARQKEHEVTMRMYRGDAALMDLLASFPVLSLAFLVGAVFGAALVMLVLVWTGL